MLNELKEKVCEANKSLGRQRLVMLTWGNVSAYDANKEIVAIKPSGVKFELLKPKHIVLLDLHGNVVSGDKKPSSDTPTHLELYRSFTEIGSVVHTHSIYATSFATAKKSIECLGTTHADHFKGAVPVTRNLTDKEIEEQYELNTGKVIVEHFQKNKLNHIDIPACLVSSHGPFVWGRTVESALKAALVLELMAKMNFIALNLNSKIDSINKKLHDKHFDRKHGINAYYGQKR